MSRAVEKGDVGVVKLLLENGAQLDFEDANGQTPLSRAVDGRNIAVLQLLLAKEAKMDFKYNIVSGLHPYLNEYLLD